MNKLRRCLATIALVATLSGLSLQGVGQAAQAASSLHVRPVQSTSVAVKSVRPNWPCPVPGTYDC